ncbi:MAG: hypothetical protein RIR26_580, partial [Pseudomonadota bacterium]
MSNWLCLRLGEPARVSRGVAFVYGVGAERTISEIMRSQSFATLQGGRVAPLYLIQTSATLRLHSE